LLAAYEHLRLALASTAAPTLAALDAPDNRHD
jgi:hypothetical protein